jgi:hypothetical protein
MPNGEKQHESGNGGKTLSLFLNKNKPLTLQRAVIKGEMPTGKKISSNGRRKVNKGTN